MCLLVTDYFDEQLLWTKFLLEITVKISKIHLGIYHKFILVPIYLYL